MGDAMAAASTRPTNSFSDECPGASCWSVPGRWQPAQPPCGPRRRWPIHAGRRSAPSGDTTPHPGGWSSSGGGIAGLGCAYRLWLRHGIAASVYEYNTLAGGRIRTLRGYFDDDQLVEEHAEFVNPEHTATLALAHSFGLSLDNTDKYPSGTHPQDETLRFHGKPWSQKPGQPRLARHGDGSCSTTPPSTPPRGPSSTTTTTREVACSTTCRRPSGSTATFPGGMASDFGALCVSAVLDEFGGPPDEQSALNLVYLLGEDDSSARRFPAAPRRRHSAEPTRSGTSTAEPTYSSPD